MENEIILTPHFEALYKRLAKKFTSLDNDLDDLVTQLHETQTFGESLGAGLYKIRLAVESKGGGKSGGFRVITYLVKKTPKGIRIYLVAIYDKSEESNILKSKLLKMVKAISLAK